MFDTCSLAHATVESIHEVNKVICKLKSETVTLKFQHLGNDSDTSLVVFSNASLGNLPNGGTQGGAFVALKSKTGKFPPLFFEKNVW